MSKRRRYDLVSYMRERADEQARRRRDAGEGQYVVGRFVCVDHVFTLECIGLDRATWQVIESPLVKDWRQFHRWRTRQAAHQWINATTRLEPDTLIVVDLARLCDGGKRRRLDDGQPDPNAAALTNVNRSDAAPLTPVND